MSLKNHIMYFTTLVYLIELNLFLEYPSLQLLFLLRTKIQLFSPYKFEITEIHIYLKYIVN